jgi:hypothetical protein
VLIPVASRTGIPSKKVRAHGAAMPAVNAQKTPALKEVEAAINGASSDQRLKMLLGLTDLFLASQARLLRKADQAVRRSADQDDQAD